MTDRHKFGDPLAAPLAQALATGLDRSSRDCPDAETLALYFDRALAAGDAARWELHFSACARCQQQLAAMARMETAAATPASEPQLKGIAWLWNRRWLVPAAAALGALAIWVVVSNVTSPVSPAGPQVAQKIEPQAPVTPVSPTTQEAAAGRAPVAGNEQAAATHPGRSAAENAASAMGGKPVSSEGTAKQLSGERADRPFAFETAPKDAPAPVGALVGVKKNAPAAASAEPLHIKKEQEREAQTKAVEVVEPAAQPPATLHAQQQVAQAPQARSEEQDLRAARDELKKAQAEPFRPATEAAFVEPAPDAAAVRRQKSLVGGRFAAVNVAGAKLVWRFGPAGSIERSDDAGATWRRQSSGVTVDLLAGSAPSATVCWAVGRGGVVLRTTDGSTWLQLGSPTSQDLIAVVALDANRATVTIGDGKSYVTTDAGRTWNSQ